MDRELKSLDKDAVKPGPPGVPVMSRSDRRHLVRELATGELTRSALARKYRVTPAAITQFAKRHATEIQEIKKNLEDDYAGLWIAQKEQRINAYQEDYDAALDSKYGHHHEWIKARTQILRAVAEELGALPPRATIAVVPVQHVIVGIDMDELT